MGSCIECIHLGIFHKTYTVYVNIYMEVIKQYRIYSYFIHNYICIRS